MIRRPMWDVLPLLLTLALASCGTQSKSSGDSAASGSSDLTEYQRDSMLSTSTIPGARGVGAAMRASEATGAGIRAADSVSP